MASHDPAIGGETQVLHTTTLQDTPNGYLRLEDSGKVHLRLSFRDGSEMEAEPPDPDAVAVILYSEESHVALVGFELELAAAELEEKIRHEFPDKFPRDFTVFIVGNPHSGFEDYEHDLVTRALVPADKISIRSVPVSEDHVIVVDFDSGTGKLGVSTEIGEFKRA